MAQKVHPISYRSLQSFENDSNSQKNHGPLNAYVLHQNLAVSSFLKGFFRSLALRLHSFRYVKSFRGNAHLIIKYVPFFSREIRKKPSLVNTVRFTTLNRAISYGLSSLIPQTTIKISFLNLAKNHSNHLLKHPITPLFSKVELSAFFKALLNTRGAAFFLASILSNKLRNMRSRSERKKQKSFLLFIKLFLVNLLSQNLVHIQGLRVSVKGRVNGVPRSKNWVVSEGKMALQRINATIDYYYLPSQTPFGTFGIKVWVNYGEKKIHATT
jgi:hypothetical protein